MVNWTEDRDYITPQDYPVGSIIPVTITEVQERENERKFYRVFATDVNEKFISFNLSDNVGTRNFHGQVIRQVFGDKVFDTHEYNGPEDLVGKTVRLLVSSYVQKYDQKQNKVINYPKFEVAPGGRMKEPTRTVHQTRSEPTVETDEVCDVCNKPLGEFSLTEVLDGETYHFCTKKCKASFLN